MIPLTAENGDVTNSVPRMRGDDPTSITARTYHINGVPRMRGDDSNL